MIFMPSSRTATIFLNSRVAEHNLHQFAGFGADCITSGDVVNCAGTTPNTTPGTPWWQQAVVGWTNPAAAIALIDSLRRPAYTYQQPLSNYMPLIIGGIALVGIAALTMRH